MTRHERLYRRFLGLYPAEFRSDYVDEMARLFSDQLLDARSTGGRWGVADLWARSFVDLIATAPGVHMRREGHVPQPVDMPSSATVSSSGPAVRQGPRVLIGLLPLWFLLFLGVAAPGFVDPLFANPPAFLGLPAGVVILGVALALMLLGVLILRRAATALALAAFLFCTVPSIVLIVLGPATVLIAYNLTA